MKKNFKIKAITKIAGIIAFVTVIGIIMTSCPNLLGDDKKNRY